MFWRRAQGDREKPAPPERAGDAGHGPPVDDSGMNLLLECRHGRMLCNRHDMYVGRSLLTYGEFSELESVVLRQLVRPGDTVVEVGANIGAHTVALAKLAGPAGRLVAVEPQRVVHQMLCANLALNDITWVRCLHAAAGAAPGEIRVPHIDYRQTSNFGGVALGAYTEGEPVPVLTVDALQLPELHLLKIDVEGMELDVLRGAAQTLVRCRPAVYVENDREDRSAALVAWLDAAGYAMYWHVTPLFNPDNYFGIADNVFGDLVSRNMLCFPRSVPHRVDLPPVEVTSAVP